MHFNDFAWARSDQSLLALGTDSLERPLNRFRRYSNGRKVTERSCMSEGRRNRENFGRLERLCFETVTRKFVATGLLHGRRSSSGLVKVAISSDVWTQWIMRSVFDGPTNQFFSVTERVYAANGQNIYTVIITGIRRKHSLERVQNRPVNRQNGKDWSGSLAAVFDR